MRIAIDARELSTSTGRYVERLLHYLQKVDNEHDYLVLLKPADVAKWQPTNPRFKPVACPHKEFTFAEQISLKKQLDQLKPDLVHFAMPQQPIRYRGNKITTFHDLTTLRFNNPTKNWLVFKFKQQVYRLVIKSAARHSRALIAISQFTKFDVAKFTSVTAEKITVIYEAADPITEAPKAVDGLADEPFIMYVGRPTPHKNLERLVEAFGQISQVKPGVKLVLAGKYDQNYARIKQLVDKGGLTDSVIFTDFISESQLRWLYEHCSAYVFPSLSEGFGLPGLEAMAHGAPVVASRASCLPEIYGEAAHYFNPLDSHDIAAKVVDVLSDEKLRQNLITKGRAQAAKYSWQTMATQTLEVYKKALNER